MKAKLLFVTASCLLISFPLSTIAQDIGKPATNVDRVREFWIGRVTKSVFEEDSIGYLSFGLIAEREALPLGFRTEFEITDEQRRNMQALMVKAMHSEKPEYLIEMNRFCDTVVEKVIADANYILTEDEEAAFDTLIRYEIESAKASVAETLTDEQARKMDGMLLALTGGLASPFFTERHMAALDLTDEQKAQLKAINEEMKPERDKVIAALSPEVAKIVEANELNLTGLISTLPKFRELSNELKKRRTAVLTESQVAKAKTLSQLPKFLSIFNVIPQWLPGPNSWKPGDPIPAQYQQERNPRSRFPRAEN
jgi:Spy/CpxP family protein refolding chaperone